MTLCYRCNADFEPPAEYPRRRICPVCIQKRPGHLRERNDNLAAIRFKPHGKAYPPLPPSVSVGIEPDPSTWAALLNERRRQAQREQADAEGRRKNVIPFRRKEPPTRPTTPFSGPYAA